MSLILEALRKLEREKQSPDAGLVVVGQTPWTGGSPGGSRPGLIVLAIALVGAGIGLGVWLGRAPGRGPAPSPTPAAASAMAPRPMGGDAPATTAGATADASVPATQDPRPVEPARPSTEPQLPAGTRSIPGEPSGAGAVQFTPATPAPVAPPAAGGAASPPSLRTAPAPPAAPTAAAADADAEHDPLAAPRATRGELKLQAISQRDGHPIAVINERLVREGESFDGVLVVKIGKAEVEIEVGGRRRTLIF